jgi:hypothetical protein
VPVRCVVSGRRWRKYPTLRAWCVGRILFAPGATLKPSQLAKPPGYLVATERDAQDELRRLRDDGIIAAHSARWYVLNARRAHLIARTLKPKAVAND